MCPLKKKSELHGPTYAISVFEKVYKLSLKNCTSKASLGASSKWK